MKNLTEEFCKTTLHPVKIGVWVCRYVATIDNLFLEHNSLKQEYFEQNGGTMHPAGVTLWFLQDIIIWAMYKLRVPHKVECVLLHYKCNKNGAS